MVKKKRSEINTNPYENKNKTIAKPPQHSHVKINSYGDDLSITSQHRQIRTATTHLQQYINTLEE